MAYFRQRITKAGTVSTALVESYRDGQGEPRQRVLVNLHGEPERALARRRETDEPARGAERTGKRRGDRQRRQSGQCHGGRRGDRIIDTKLAALAREQVILEQVRDV